MPDPAVVATDTQCAWLCQVAGLNPQTQAAVVGACIALAGVFMTQFFSWVRWRWEQVERARDRSIGLKKEIFLGCSRDLGAAVSALGRLSDRECSLEELNRDYSKSMSSAQGVLVVSSIDLIKAAKAFAQAAGREYLKLMILRMDLDSKSVSLVNAQRQTGELKDQLESIRLNRAAADLELRLGNMNSPIVEAACSETSLRRKLAAADKALKSAEDELFIAQREISAVSLRVVSRLNRPLLEVVKWMRIELQIDRPRSGSFMNAAALDREFLDTILSAADELSDLVEKSELASAMKIDEAFPPHPPAGRWRRKLNQVREGYRNLWRRLNA